MSEVFEAFIQDYRRREKDSTANTYEKLLAQFQKWRDRVGNPGEFGKENVLSFLKQKDWSNSSKNTFLAALSSWCSSELEKVSPPTTDEEKREVRRLKRIKGIKSYDDDSKEKEPLTMDKILDCKMVMEDDTKKLFWVLLWFGVRYGELTEIKNIDYGEGSLTVKTIKRSDNHERTLYFDEYTGKILRYVESKNLLEIPYNTLYKKLKKIGRQVGIDLTPHICRHTFSTQMGERVDAFSLAKMLGHTMESTSKRLGASKVTGKYVHPSEERIKEVMTQNHYLQSLEVKK